MKKIMIRNGMVWRSDNRFSSGCPVLLADGKIQSVGGADASADLVIDATGKYVIPGLLDVHTHGRAGFDYVSATEEQMRLMREDAARHGVTALFPTLASATEAQWIDAIRRIQNCGFEGIHLEGRYLNPLKRGAHAPELLVPPDAVELERILSEISVPCHVTAAFELDKDGSFAACALRHGATLGLGHTNATSEEAALAMKRGVTSFTHLFNTMPPLHHRAGGAACTALNGDGWVELIVDGIHVCPDMVRLAYRCKSKDKFVLITDSMQATGCPDGDGYLIAGEPVRVVGGKAVTFDGALAGSTLNLLDGVKNLMRFADVSFADAVACATVNPARMVGVDSCLGSIDVGKRADLLILDDQFTLLHVIRCGELLF